jgi:hypothetical protein
LDERPLDPAVGDGNQATEPLIFMSTYREPGRGAPQFALAAAPLSLP